MASLVDIGLAAAINILSAFIFLMLFAILRLQPIFDRVYFPKWYLKGIRSSPTHSRTLVRNIFNVDSRSYIRFLNWMPEALRMPQLELIEHAGLDSAVYIRIYLLGLKIFVPLTVLAFAVLVPVNWTGETLDHVTNLTFSDIDKISISNVPPGSKRFWAHLSMSYIFTFWTCYVLYNEYEIVASMRLRFLASEDRRPDQFTVLVRNIPPDSDESVSEHVEHFFYVNHPDHYLSHQVVYNANHLANVVEKKMSLQNSLDYYEKKYIENPSKKPSTKTGFCGLWGRSVDAIEFYTAEIEKLTKEEDTEREKVVSDPKAIMPVAFVSFKSRWGAAVCAQTQQTSNPTIWLTDWAPEPRDVYWPNLSVPFVKLSIRRFLMAIALFFLTFFYIIPIAFVQSLANIEGIEKVFPFLKSVINGVVKSFIQGFLPGIALKIFLILLPTILMIMTKIEGHTSISALERRSAAKYYLFILVNVFLMNIITGTALQQLHNFINQSANEIPKTIGVSMPMKATFFITYIMVDGWAGVAAEIIRLKPLVMFQLKKWFLVKTDQDMKQATNPGSLDFSSSEPRIQLYFLLGLVYSVVTPFLLPFIVIFFGFSYVVFRHQIINVYHQQYESGAAFWPDVHRRIITGLVISHMLLIGLMSSKDFAESSAVLIALPILTIWFHTYCKSRFESAFVKFPLQDAMVKDTLERATEPTFNLKAYLQDAYVHPVFKDGYFERPTAIDEEESNPLVPTKRQSYRSTPAVSKYGSEISSEHEVGITL
ncbi:CSC1-like protein At4g02900 isoform X1 [Magnolia sinica]|uniref:CSC1-like protein At4g02900 isoform X1 n=1 Tax=Magnolia sinica TaxID=86752 RepID=UPI00265B49E1|nr:CSC1-like protein At4g02900 isoform X1 [Magnolia sinica]